MYTKSESDGRYLQSVSFPLPNYGVSSDTTTYENTTVHSSTNVLSFLAPLTFTTTNYQNKNLNAVPYSSLNVSYVGLDTSQYYTKTEVDALIAAGLPAAGGGGSATVLFENATETDANQSSSDHWIMGPSLAGHDVDGKSWTLCIDLWVSNWSSAHGQGLALYGGKTNYPDGSRTAVQYLMFNLYYPSSSHPNGGVPHIFLNDQNGDVTMATVSGISSSTCFTLKVRYDTTQSQYNVYVNNAFQGSYTVIRETQKYTRLNQLLIMSPDVNQKHRNVKLYEGIV